jgi:hypothetical protein
MSEKIAVSKDDLIDVMLILLSGYEDEKKAIEKLQSITGISDAELTNLHWKKEYNGK